MKLSLRQENIIDAAMDIIRKDGIEKLSMRNLSKRLALTEGAIYRHFESKDEIYKMIFHLGKTVFETTLNGISEDLDSLDMLHTFYTEICKSRISDRSLAASCLVLDKLGMINFRFEIGEFEDLEYNILVKIIKQGQIAKEIRNDSDPEMLALMIQGSNKKLLTDWVVSAFKVDLLDQTDKLWVTIKQILSWRNQ